MIDPRTFTPDERRDFWINVYANIAAALILGAIVAFVHAARSS